MFIVMMRHDSKTSDIGNVLKKIEELGLKSHLSKENNRTIIGVVGDNALVLEETLAGFSGVESIIPIKQPFKLVSREFKKEDTQVAVGPVEIGGKPVVVIAGPCAVESEEQLLEAAKCVKEAGVKILRGGAFKPRTSPYSFQGLGKEGLLLLKKIGDQLDLRIVTEVLSPNDVELVAQYADMLQIGARNMQNFSLLQEVGKSRKPVLLKRGMMNTLEELFMAAEYIASNGNRSIVLCERGIRTFENYTRNTLDISAVAVTKQLSHLPIVIDPSHAAGQRDLVGSLAKAAIAAGADGLLIEVHPQPEKALSDGPQSLNPKMFSNLMKELRRVALAVDRTI